MNNEEFKEMYLLRMKPETTMQDLRVLFGNRKTEEFLVELERRTEAIREKVNDTPLMYVLDRGDSNKGFR